MNELYRTYKFYNTNKRRLSIFAEQADHVSANVYVLIHNPKDGCFVKKQGYEEFIKNKDKYFFKTISCYNSDDFIKWCKNNFIYKSGFNYKDAFLNMDLNRKKPINRVILYSQLTNLLK